MFRYALLILLLIFAAILPKIVTDQYYLHLIIMAGIFSLLTMGLNLIYGYVGQLSLGHTAFFGIGAYTSAILALRLGMNFGGGILLSILVSLLAGLFIGHVTLRLRGAFFVIVSLSFSEIIYLIAINWVDFTGGAMGLPGIPPAALWIPGYGRFEFLSKASFYYLLLAIVASVVYALSRMINSHLGNAFIALRENEDLAESVGISAYRYSMLAFTVGAILAGIAGSLYAHYIGFTSPEVFGFQYMIIMLVMVIMGGLGTIWGPVVGSILFTIIPEFLRIAKGFREPIFGGLLVVAIIFIPQGIVPLWHRLTEGILKRRGNSGSFGNS